MTCRATLVVAVAIVIAGCGTPAGSAESTEIGDQTSATPATETGTQSTTETGPRSPTEKVSSPEPTVQIESKPPALDSQLYGLVTADNRSAYATRHGLSYQNGSVRVVIELAAGRSLPTEYDVTVALRQGELVQGSVAVDDLVGLARHRNVSAVRPPAEPQVD